MTGHFNIMCGDIVCLLKNICVCLMTNWNKNYIIILLECRTVQENAPSKSATVLCQGRLVTHVSESCGSFHFYLVTLTF